MQYPKHDFLDLHPDFQEQDTVIARDISSSITCFAQSDFQSSRCMRVTSRLAFKIKQLIVLFTKRSEI